jgi:hypothetical protein
MPEREEPQVKNGLRKARGPTPMGYKAPDVRLNLLKGVSSATILAVAMFRAGTASPFL